MMRGVGDGDGDGDGDGEGDGDADADGDADGGLGWNLLDAMNQPFWHFSRVVENIGGLFETDHET